MYRRRALLGETFYNQGKWEEFILKDFAEFRKRGLNHPDMVRIEKALAKAPPSALAKAADDIDTLNEQVKQLYDQGKFAEANVIAGPATATASLHQLQQEAVFFPYLVDRKHLN